LGLVVREDTNHGGDKGWPMPLGIDHHTWFNIFAYGLIFLMIWMYDRAFRTRKGSGLQESVK
jgi:hypothetical protein